MQTHVKNSQENVSRSAAADNTKVQSSEASSLGIEDNRPEVVVQRKLQGIANDSPEVSRQRNYQAMADNSPQAMQTTQLQAMADNFTVRQQPVQKKGNTSILPSAQDSVQANLNLAAGSFLSTLSGTTTDSGKSPVQLTRIGINMTKHYNDHTSDKLPKDSASLIKYVDDNWKDFREQGGENRWVLDLGTFQTKRFGGAVGPREWNIVMMGDTIIHFGPTGG